MSTSRLVRRKVEDCARSAFSGKISRRPNYRRGIGKCHDGKNQSRTSKIANNQSIKMITFPDCRGHLSPSAAPPQDWRAPLCPWEALRLPYLPVLQQLFLVFKIGLKITQAYVSPGSRQERNTAAGRALGLFPIFSKLEKKL